MNNISLEEIDRQVEEKLREMLASGEMDRILAEAPPRIIGLERRDIQPLASSRLPTLSEGKYFNKVGFTRKEVEYE